MAVQTMHLINNDAGPQTLKSRPGDVFTLGAYLYPKTGNTGGGTATLQLVCTSTVSGGPASTTVVAATESVPATGSWSYLTGTAIVPAGYDTVDPQLILTSVPTSDYVFIDDVLVREVTAAQNAVDKIYQALTGTSTTNNTLTTLGTQFSTWLTNLFGAGNYVSSTAIAPGAVPNISATKITSGTFAQSMVTGLSTFITGLATAGGATGASPLVQDLQTMIDNLNKAVNNGAATTGNPVTTWLTNLQTWMTNLWGSSNMPTTPTVATGAIPNLSATKITSGTFAQSMVTGLSTFITGLATAGGATGASPLVQDLQTMIDNLNKAVNNGAGTTGNAVSTWLTNLQTWMTNLWGTTNMGATPVVATGAIPNISATKITSGQIGTAILPTAIPSANVPALSALYAPNLVLQPDFESTTLWAGANGTQDTLQAHSGTHSWQLQGAG